MSRTSSVSYIYNPLNQTEEELLKNFVVREREFNTIFNEIKGSDMSLPEPHFIVQGQRGQGKTTLLLKLYYEIRRDKKLSKFIIPLIYNEEQYHINTLFGLWSHTAEKLEEEEESFKGIYDAVEATYNTEDSEMEAFKSLEGALKKKKKKLILLIDNIGQLLDKLTRKEQQRLREVLITGAEIRLVGASSVVLEHTYDYSKPFYELFRWVNLYGLTRKEAETLLLKLGEYYKQENIKKIIEYEPGRVEALRRLTGGVPRTVVLLFEIFVDHEEGNAFQDLEFILDRVTPLYKHRMDDLSPQQQKIVDAIALNWDAMATKEIAEKTRMESKAVSSQLKLLEKNRIIHKIKTTTKNYFYQVTERFFNIWYLMRYGRQRGKSRVQWLVHFLQNWCDETELSERAKKHILSMGKGTMNPKYALYFTEALAGTKIPELLQDDLITHTRFFLEDKDRGLLKELSKSDIELIEEANRYSKENETEKALRSLKAVQNKSGGVLFALGVLHGLFEDYEKAEYYYLQGIEKGDPHSMAGLFALYFILKKNKEKALELVKEASKKGQYLFTTSYLPIILLWNNEIEESLKVANELIKNEEIAKNYFWVIGAFFTLLLAKKQYYAALKMFNENPFDLKERLKPVYYALMHFLEDDFPNETKKMGEELKQTVDEIIQNVHQWEKDYA